MIPIEVCTKEPVMGDNVSNFSQTLLNSLQNVFKRTGWLHVFPYIALADIKFHIVIQPCPPRELRRG